MNITPYVKMVKSEYLDELVKDHSAFALLAVIASKVKTTNSFSIHNLKRGQVLLENCSFYGFKKTAYANAKKRLEKYGFATFEGTKKGTIATLSNNKIFNIASKSSNTTDYDKILSKWNSFAIKNNLQTIIKLTDKRKSLIDQRLNEDHFDVDIILDKVNQSSVLLGKSSKGRKVTFDFIFQSDNYIKILEGNYDNVESPQMSDEYKSLIDEVYSIWKPSSRGSYDEVIHAFTGHVKDCKEEIDLLVSAVKSYRDSDSVSNDMVMKLPKFIREWRNHTP